MPPEDNTHSSMESRAPAGSPGTEVGASVLLVAEALEFQDGKLCPPPLTLRLVGAIYMFSHHWVPSLTLDSQSVLGLLHLDAAFPRAGICLPLLSSKQNTGAAFPQD